MSTRAAYGFRYQGQDKVTYNHSDGYPTWLGKNICEFIQEVSLLDLPGIFQDIILVNDNVPPNSDQVLECEGFIDLHVGSQKNTDWYCLLRKTQGYLNAYLDKRLRYMLDNQAFLLDSLFCEWAYIINLDTQLLEIYAGFNKDRKAPGRYAGAAPDGEEYAGVVLVATGELGWIQELSEEELMQWVAYLEGIDSGIRSTLREPMEFDSKEDLLVLTKEVVS